MGDSPFSESAHTVAKIATSFKLRICDCFDAYCRQSMAYESPEVFRETPKGIVVALELRMSKFTECIFMYDVDDLL